MKIIRLKINNILNLQAIDVRPDKHVNKVSGKNAAGKSNLLEAIRFSLLGKRAMPPEPLKKGAKKGDIEVNLGDYIVKVKITKAGEYWNVTDKDGKPVTKQMDLLKEIVGPISFDPLAMLDDDQKKLRAVLLELVGVNLDEFDTDIKAIRDDRTVQGRINKQAQALSDAATWHEDAPKEEVLVTDLVNELRRNNEDNAEILKAGERLDDFESTVKLWEDQIADRKKTIAVTREWLQSHAIIDTAPLNEKINNAGELNQKVRDNTESKKLSNAALVEQVEYDKLTEAIEELEAEKDQALHTTPMPVVGLSVDEDGVTFEGIPLQQVNKAKRIEIGCAIHMAMNPELKVMFIEGAHFDKETEAAIEAAVKDKDYQLFSEVVDDDAETGIHLVDGTIQE